VPQRHTIPPYVEAAVFTALEKLPADRFASAKDFADALDGKGGTYAATTRLPAHPPGFLPTHPPTRFGRALALIAATALISATATWALLRNGRTGAPVPVVSRYEIVLPDTAAYMNPPAGASVALTPDGSVLAYSSRSGLMLRYTDRVDPVPVPGGRRGSASFFSPDGQWLAFQDGPRLLKVPLAGGATVAICDSCVGYSFNWGSDDTVRFHSAAENNGNIRVLMAVSARGGTPREFARPDSGSGESFRQPILLPGRRTVLFSVYTGNTSRLAALDLKTGTITRFDQAGFSPQWVARGFVALGSADGSLIALPFDAAGARPTGAPVTMVRDVLTPDALTGSRAAVAATGSIVYAQSGAASTGQLTLVSRAGQATPITAEAKSFENPRVSPSGDRVAVAITESDGSSRDVWVLDITQHAWSRLTTNGISDRPIWTPDGRRIVYSSNSDLWWIAADGGGRPDSLFVENGSHTAGSVTPDGRAVVFLKEGSLSAGIRALAFDSAPAARMVIPARFNETAPALSPDGHWLAYQSDEAGRMEVYVRPYPGPGAQVPVSLLGGTEPVWSRNGRELFYRSGDSLMTASVTLSPMFAVTGRHSLFTNSFLSSGRFPEYDVTPDGQHFVMIRGGPERSSLIALNNVFDRLAYDRQAKK
jgi:serine/threonine-protein kinase